MRLATFHGPHGSYIDPTALVTARRMSFAWSLEHHEAQDALDDVAEIWRKEAEAR